MLENLFYQEQDKSISVTKETVGIVISLQHMGTIIRLRHMRRAIASTCLCACLKYRRKAHLVWLRKLQDAWQIARLEQQHSLLSLSVKQKDLTRKSCVFVISLVQWWKLYYQKQQPEVFLKFAKFTGKHKCQSLFFNKFAGATMSLLIVITWKSLNIVYSK